MSRPRFIGFSADTLGNVNANKVVTLLNSDGSAFTGTVYDAASGGSVVTSFATNASGVVELYTDESNAKYIRYQVATVTGTFDGAFDIDPAQSVTLTAVQTLTNKTLTAPVLTGTGTFVNLTGSGNLRVGGTTRLGSTSGFWQDSVGRIALFDHAVTYDGSTLPTNSRLIAAVTSAINEVAYDWQFLNSFPGTLVLSGTIDSAAASSLTDAEFDFSTANAGGTVGGCFVKITNGADTGEYRLVNSVSGIGNHVAGINTPWTSTPSAGDTYEIRSVGDMGTSRTEITAQAGNVASTRAGEFQAIRLAGSADAGVKVLEVGLHSEVAFVDPLSLIAVDAFCDTGFLPSSGVNAKQGGVAYRASGNKGFAHYFRAESTAGAVEFDVLNGGILAMLGKLTVGTVTSGNALVNVKQSADDTSGGARFIQSAGTNFAGVFMGASGDEGAFFQATVSAEAGAVRVGAKSAEATLTANALTAHTGNLFEAVRVGSTKFAIDADGNVNLASGAVYKVNSQQVLGARGAAVAAVAGSIPAGGVGAAAGAFDTSGNRDTFIATVTEMKTQLNLLMARFRVTGGHGAIAD